jgi:hypothetical protein
VKINAEVHVYPGDTEQLVRIERQLARILQLIQSEGNIMSALSDAVDALVARVSEDTQHLLDLLAEAQAAAAAAEANDAADAQAIADAQAERDAALADAQATVDRINSIDPVADFPTVEAPPEP